VRNGRRDASFFVEGTKLAKSGRQTVGVKTKFVVAY
jgi:hypothetical protein